MRGPDATGADVLAGDRPVSELRTGPATRCLEGFVGGAEVRERNSTSPKDTDVVVVVQQAHDDTLGLGGQDRGLATRATIGDVPSSATRLWGRLLNRLSTWRRSWSRRAGPESGIGPLDHGTHLAPAQADGGTVSASVTDIAAAPMVRAGRARSPGDEGTGEGDSTSCLASSSSAAACPVPVWRCRPPADGVLRALGRRRPSAAAASPERAAAKASHTAACAARAAPGGALSSGSKLSAVIVRPAAAAHTAGAGRSCGCRLASSVSPLGAEGVVRDRLGACSNLREALPSTRALDRGAEGHRDGGAEPGSRGRYRQLRPAPATKFGMPKLATWLASTASDAAPARARGRDADTMPRWPPSSRSPAPSSSTVDSTPRPHPDAGPAATVTSTASSPPSPPTATGRPAGHGQARRRHSGGEQVATATPGTPDGSPATDRLSRR